MRTLALTLCFLAVAGLVHAKTWTVEKDGSGDFEIIQDALDAAADGDTVLVGAGRYDTFRPYDTLTDGFPLQTIAMLRTRVLLQGAGRDSTFIGPETFASDDIDGRSPGSMYVDLGAEGSVIRGFTFENTRGYVTLGARCVFEHNRADTRNKPPASAAGVAVAFGDSIIVRDCEFLGPDGLGSSNTGVVGLRVLDCTFVDDGGEVGFAVLVSGNLDFLIKGCVIRGNAAGIQFNFGTEGVVEDCDIDCRPVGTAMNVVSGLGIVRNTIIRPTRQNLRCNLGRLEVYDSVMMGGVPAGTGPGLTINTSGQVLVRRSHLLNGGGLTVESGSLASEIVDVRENWWGTTDINQIYEWVDDRGNNVLIEPILLEPVSAKEESVGGFKARFRGRN